MNLTDRETFSMPLFVVEALTFLVTGRPLDLARSE